MLMWGRTFLPPHSIPQWAMSFPLSLAFGRRSQEKGLLQAVRPICNKTHLQPTKASYHCRIEDRWFSFFSQRPWASVDPHNQHLKNNNPVLLCSLWASQGSVTWGLSLSDHHRKLRNLALGSGPWPSRVWKTPQHHVKLSLLYLSWKIPELNVLFCLKLLTPSNSDQETQPANVVRTPQNYLMRKPQG